MEQNLNERIIKLCDAAIDERNPDKRFRLIAEMSQLIDMLAARRLQNAKSASV
jgi:hypothetical protein